LEFWAADRCEHLRNVINHPYALTYARAVARTS
jgi:hypothetical protein